MHLFILICILPFNLYYTLKEAIMVFVWRGSGITVPIFLLISGWITGYWFEDTRLGNSAFMGWTLLWAGIILTLQGVADWGGGKPDPETGQIHIKKGHDFFWIPVLIWGLAFMGLSIWLINKTPDKDSTAYTESIESVEEPEVRMLNFYNPYEDSVDVELVNAKTKENVIEATIPPLSIRYKEFEHRRYDLYVDGEESRITIKGSTTKDKDDYDELWYIVGGGADLVLVDVTEACDKEITRGELRAIDWTKHIVKRYDGDGLIEPIMSSTKKKKMTIYGVDDKLPIKHRKKEHVFSLIVVKKDVDPTDAFLDEKIIGICFSDSEEEE